MKIRTPTRTTLPLLISASIASVTALATLPAAFAEEMDFDWNGRAIFLSYDQVPDTYMAADSGDRTLNRYYELRQYPGSPPRIPHPVESQFADQPTNCISCHEKGGYSPVYGKYIPVTPHPDQEMCAQCHVPLPENESFFVGHDWQSINPPKLGRSALGGSPPPIPHSLHLRENCIPCHTGPGSVIEIRVEHASRGNCRQCHVPLVNTEPVKEFTRISR